MKLFVFICLLSAFIFKGYALTCISCSSTTPKECTGSAVTCSAKNEDTCTFIYTETKLPTFGLTTYSIVRGCGYSSICEQPKTLSNPFMTVKINVTCCNTDNCTQETPQFTSFSTAKNGQECPSCFAMMADTCVPENTISCTGAENTCTSYSISRATVPPTPLMAMSGCATQSLCTNYNGTTSTSTTGEMKISVKCSKTIVSTDSTTVTHSTSNLHVTGGNTETYNPQSVFTETPLTSNLHVTGGNTDTGYPLSTKNINRVTKLESTRTDSQIYHYTTKIANPGNDSTLPNNYTTRITFTPTIFHSVTHQPVTSCCVCNGSVNLGCSLGLILILSLIKCLH